MRKYHRIYVSLIVLAFSSLYLNNLFGDVSNNSNKYSYKKVIDKYLPNIINDNLSIDERNIAIGDLRYNLSFVRNVLKNKKSKDDIDLHTKLASDLIDAYAKINDRTQKEEFFRKTVVEIIVRFCNDKKSHLFIRGILINGDDKMRDIAVKRMSRLGLHGDDIWDTIEKLVENRTLSRKEILPTLQKIDKEKARDYIVKIAKNTNDIEEFMVASSVLSNYDEPELLYIPLSRSLSMKKTSKYDPIDSILSIDLLKYIERMEGEKLEIGYEVLKRRGYVRKDIVKILENKLVSNNKKTQEISIKFAKDIPRLNRSIKNKDIIDIFNNRLKNEGNSSIQIQLRQAILDIKERDNSK